MKYRLVEDNGLYEIEIYDRDGLFFGPKNWKKTTIATFLPINTYKSNKIIDCKFAMFKGLSFQRLQDAEIVYDYIVNHNTIDDKCLSLILRNDVSEGNFKILKEN